MNLVSVFFFFIVDTKTLTVREHLLEDGLSFLPQVNLELGAHKTYLISLYQRLRQASIQISRTYI